jgi:hypothetical protein
MSDIDRFAITRLSFLATLFTVVCFVSKVIECELSIRSSMGAAVTWGERAEDRLLGDIR